MGNQPSYTNKLAEPGFIGIVNQSRNNALMHYNMELWSIEEQEAVL